MGEQKPRGVESQVRLQKSKQGTGHSYALRLAPSACGKFERLSTHDPIMAIFSVAIVREKVRVARRMLEPLESMVIEGRGEVSVL